MSKIKFNEFCEYLNQCYPEYKKTSEMITELHEQGFSKQKSYSTIYSYISNLMGQDRIESRNVNKHIIRGEDVWRVEYRLKPLKPGKGKSFLEFLVLNPELI